MRAVVYDPQDFEPLTVIDVPQKYVREIEAGSRPPLLRFAIYEEPVWSVKERVELSLPKVAEVMFERLVYKGLGRSPVSTWILIALNPEICLLMKSDLLPGQRHDDFKRQRAAFTNGMLAAMGI